MVYKACQKNIKQILLIWIGLQMALKWGWINTSLSLASNLHSPLPWGQIKACQLKTSGRVIAVYGSNT